ncbi:LytTr DNA-binding domain-containing protein [Catalinimonas alkaloidigena]|uniref:LytTr DNA-binding domain-containing protein n=1 Tax=Catalinimonas alkaloidigena TaxID=1075417 RepID=A0A1G9KRM7_9BACT|nr:LytTR family DNA-binding domain-containing protein [Catalinimonas alkaloidigena]SDL52500.1 LytTr DNA-binding domain-containing protein [Catalinimonas alkaloidigena]
MRFSTSTLFQAPTSDRPHFWFGLFALVAAGLTVGQDFLHATYHAYAFYLSESFLFSSFWGLFFPLLYLQTHLARKYQTRNGRHVGVMLALVLLHLALAPLVITVLSGMLLDHTYDYTTGLRYTLAEDVYKCLLVYGLAAWVHVCDRSIPAAAARTTEPQPVQRLAVGTGQKTRVIPVEDILFISTERPYLVLHTAGEKHLHASSLTQLAAQLDARQFVRVHKSTVVNLKKVVSYQSRRNGDYDLTLQNGAVVRMSRRYSGDFKARMG